MILKPSRAGLHSLLTRAIFAHSQNQQQQITLQTEAKAPALHGTQLRSFPAETDFVIPAARPGRTEQGTRLGDRGGGRDAAAMPSPAGGGGRSQTLEVPGAGSARSLAGRRAGRHRRGVGIAGHLLQRVLWPQLSSDLPGLEGPAPGSAAQSPLTLTLP